MNEATWWFCCWSSDLIQIELISSPPRLFWIYCSSQMETVIYTWNTFKLQSTSLNHLAAVCLIVKLNQMSPYINLQMWEVILQYRDITSVYSLQILAYHFRLTTRKGHFLRELFIHESIHFHALGSDSVGKFTVNSFLRRKIIIYFRGAKCEAIKAKQRYNSPGESTVTQILVEVKANKNASPNQNYSVHNKILDGGGFVKWDYLLIALMCWIFWLRNRTRQPHLVSFPALLLPAASRGAFSKIHTFSRLECESRKLIGGSAIHHRQTDATRRRRQPVGRGGERIRFGIQIIKLVGLYNGSLPARHAAYTRRHCMWWMTD